MGQKQTRCAKWHCVLKYFIKYENISKIFHEIFQHQKIPYFIHHYLSPKYLNQGYSFIQNVKYITNTKISTKALVEK